LGVWSSGSRGKGRSMTLTSMISRVRERSRTSDDFVADSIIVDRINEAIIQLAKDMGGLVKEAYLPLTPKFDMSTHHAFNITIVGGTNALVATDIPVTDAALNDVAGAATATELQERIRAAGPTTLLVTWSASTYKFTIDGDDCTSIEILAPVAANYADATDLFFGKAGKETATTWVSNVPQDCMLTVALPSDFLRIKAVEWDRNPLSPAPFDLFMSPQAHGTPCYYQIIDKTMRINAVPVAQKLFHLFYYYSPATLVVVVDADTDIPVEAEIEDAIIFYSTVLLKEDEGDLEKAGYFRARYIIAKNEYKQQLGNQNPKFRTYRKGTIRKEYRVIT